MNNHVLSQDEVDALLQAVSEGERDLEQTSRSRNGRREGTVVTYDLTSQDKIIRGRLPQLDVIYEKFMRSFRVSLSSSLRQIAALNHASTDFMKFGEYINTLPMPTAMSVIRFNSLRGSAMVVFEGKFVNGIVDSYMGGGTLPPTSNVKDFTGIELKLIRKVTELVIDDLEAAFASVIPADITFIRTESNPQFVGIVPPTDVVIASTFDVEFEHFDGTIQLLIPYSTIEPIKDKLSSGFQVEAPNEDVKKSNVRKLTASLAESSLELTVNLGKVSLPISKVSALAAGDVLSLGHPVDKPLDLLVEGSPLFTVSKIAPQHGNETFQIKTKKNKE